MDYLLGLIQQHGGWVYLGLFAYCLLKSGTLPLFAGFAAQQQALDLGWVVAVVLAGGVLGDEGRFWLGRRYGDGWAEGRPQIQKWIRRCRLLLEHYGVWYLFLYRYPKGMRTIGALPVGLTQMPWSQFSVLNFASALTWTNVMVGLGYVFGASIQSAIEQGYGLITLVLLLGMVAWGWWLIRQLEQAVDQNS